MKKPEILISVVTVSLNSENTIEKTITSVLKQGFKNYEYIIVDGKSTDQTVNIIKKYSPFFEGRLRYISEPDNGWYDAMNKGINMSRGAFINFLNSDDYYEEDALHIINDYIVKNNISDHAIIYGDSTNIYKNSKGQIYYRRIAAPKSINIENKRIKDGMCGIRHQSMFVGRKVYDKIGCLNLKFKLHADWDFFIKSLYDNIPYFYIKKNLTYYSMYGVSTSLNVTERHLVRKENHLYHGVDWTYWKDKIGLKTIIMKCVGNVKWNELLFWIHSHNIRVRGD